MNNFITENYDKILKMAKNICKCDRSTSDELAHYAIEQFLTHKSGQERTIGLRYRSNYRSKSGNTRRHGKRYSRTMVQS